MVLVLTLGVGLGTGLAIDAVLSGEAATVALVFFGVGCFVSFDFTVSSFRFLAVVAVATLSPLSDLTLDFGVGFAFTVGAASRGAGFGAVLC